MENQKNRPNSLGCFASFLSPQEPKKRPNTLTFGNEGDSPLFLQPPQSPWSTTNTRAGFITPLGEYGQILSPVATTPGGSLKRKIHFAEVLVTQDGGPPCQKPRIDEQYKKSNGLNGSDEWSAAPEPADGGAWDWSVVNEMGEAPRTARNDDDDDMDNDENEAFGILPGPCSASGRSNNWDSPMSVSSPMTSRVFGVPSGSRPGTPSGGLVIKQRLRTPAGTPTSMMCDQTISGVLNLPADKIFSFKKVEESWD